MSNKKIKKILMIIIGLIPIIIIGLIFTPVVKYMYNEVDYSNYNPYNENEKDFNNIVDIVKNIKPINKLNIEGRFSISIDNKGDNFKETDLVFSNAENIYEVMKRIGILNITHNENGNIYFKMDGWLLGVYGIEYSYYPQGWKNDNNIFDKNIILDINDNWLIYDPYRFD